MPQELSALARRFVRRELERSLYRSAMYLVVVLALHIIAMIVFEGMSVEEAIWLTSTTAVTVG